MGLVGDGSRVALQQNGSGAQTRAAASRLRADNPIEQKLPRSLWRNATGSNRTLADGWARTDSAIFIARKKANSGLFVKWLN